MDKNGERTNTMTTNYYYEGTDYGTMHPFHFDFWYHLFVPWDDLNWCMLVCLLIPIVVYINDRVHWYDIR